MFSSRAAENANTATPNVAVATAQQRNEVVAEGFAWMEIQAHDHAARQKKD